MDAFIVEGTSIVKTYPLVSITFKRVITAICGKEWGERTLKVG